MSNFKDVLKMAQANDAFALELLKSPEKALKSKKLALSPAELQELNQEMSKIRKGMFGKLNDLAGIGQVASDFQGGICC